MRIQAIQHVWTKRCSFNEETLFTSLLRWFESHQHYCLAITWLVIGAIAVYDTYLTVHFQETMQYLEENPVGRWLIKADGGSVALFVGAKFVGTILVLAALPFLYLQRRTLGVIVSSGVAMCQIILLCYLTIA